MSEDNVDLHRRSVAAFNLHDVEAYVALADPRIELHSVFAAVGGASYHGHDGVRSWFRDLEDTWGEDVRFGVAAYYVVDERTLAFGELHGRGRQSGVDVALDGFQALTWRDGLAIHYKAYTDEQVCFQDLGVSKEDLTRISP